ncbi:hypothetical protein R1sor_018213 [Riccia sorocarpa]|uniref:Reverse transcriptase domain-containing protein n=1 Tax=Riccia sorocarpa TaxID=122646 RepID=A0ABD3I9G0_9MARC
MNFADPFIHLLKGLVAHGSSKIHIHGRYTRSILLGRGVRQGYSISPLLFTLTTQPLMQLLRKEERAGRITGIQIPGGQPLLHRLFADDSGVSILATEENFTNLTRTISDFEAISGARLNLTKSVVIPFNLPEAPPWLVESGCQIVKPGEHIVYLGCRAGIQLTEEEHTRDITNKLGSNSEGKAKLPLVAWDQIAQHRQHGGLGLTPFKQLSKALKMKYVARLLDGSRAEWAQMIKFFIKAELQRRAHGNQCRYWTPEEGLLLLPTIQCRNSPTARNILKGWLEVRKHLTLGSGRLDLPVSLSIHQLSALLIRYYEGDTYNHRIVQAWAKRAGITALSQLRTAAGAWRQPREISRDQGRTLTASQAAELTRFHTWIQNVTPGPAELQKSRSWRWKGNVTPWTGWQKSTSFWSQLLYTLAGPHKLNRYWQIREPGIDWNIRWKNLWGSGLATRNKIWLWRVMRQALFTGERALKCRVSEGICQRCGEEVETTAHMLWSCREATLIWNRLKTILHQSGNPATLQQSLLSSIDASLAGLHTSPAASHLIVAATQAIWKDRNLKVFRNRRSNTPISLILQMTHQEASAQINPTAGDMNWQRSLEAEIDAKSWIEAARREQQTRGGTYAGLSQRERQ